MRLGFVLALIAFCLGAQCTAINSKTEPTKPALPAQYLVHAIYTIPYFNTTEPIKMLFDAKNNRQRWEFYNGMNVQINLNGDGVSWSIGPEKDKLVCRKNAADSSTPVSLVPDVSGDDWKYKGVVDIKNVRCHNWEMKVDHGNGVVHRYNYYADVFFLFPVQYHMAGVNTVFGSHPDIYVFDFLSFVPDFQNQTAFEVPELCQSAELKEREPHHKLTVLSSLLSKVVRVDSIHSLFQEFVSKYMKKYHSEAEFVRRKIIFAKNHAFINQFNSKNMGYTLSMNHLGDLDMEEMRKTVLPMKGKFVPNVPTQEANEQLSRVSLKDLPTAVDWRLKGAVTPIKDQGSCGSCWTFGTTGTIEGAYALATGKLVSLSEQQIVDCAWSPFGGPGGNQGCGGGYTSEALEWLMRNGGLATEQSYPYLAQNSFCNSADKSSGVSIKSYVNLTVGEDFLLRAVATVGPVAVAIDASQPTFYFYSSGVYYDPNCKNGIDDLDHEVLAVGYGTTTDGHDYWIVKNSWSPHWGESGFVRMSRNRNNNCGIASQANYAIVF